MALLVLLARAARAWVVAADAVLVGDDARLDDRRLDLVEGGRGRILGAGQGAAGCRGLGGRGQRARLPVRGAARVVEPARRAAVRSGAPGLAARGAVLALDLDVDDEDVTAELLPDRVHQGAEHLVALVLVGDEGIDLREPAQVDALAQVVHVVQVLAPALVDDLEQHEALERPHQVGPKLLFAVAVGLDDVLAQLGDQRVAIDLIGLHLVDLNADRVHLLELGVEAAQVPLLGVVALEVAVREPLDDSRHLLARGVGHVLALEDPVAVLVDDLALLVHHVVVLEDALADQEVLLLLAGLVGRTESVEDPVDAVAGEETDEVVLGREVEARFAGIALTAGAATELVVDPSRLVTLGTEDEQATGLHDLLAVGGDLRLELRQLLVPRLLILRRVGLVLAAQRHLGEVLGVAAELDVDAATGHVGGDRDRSRATGLGDDLALALGVLGLRVEDGVLDAALLELVRQQLGDLDGDRSDEHRLTELVALLDRASDGAPLARLGLVDLVVLVEPLHRAVGRDLDDLELVDLHELGRLGEGGAGHARELVVAAEVVLVGDRGDGLVLLLDRHALLRLDCLVQALRPAASLEDAAGELVDDLDLALDHLVVDAALVERLRLERLLEVVDEMAVLGLVEVAHPHEPLGLLDAALGDRDRLLLLVELVVEVGDVGLRLGLEALGLVARLHLRRELGELVVDVGGLLGLAGDDQRGTRLVDQDVVDLVDDREAVAPLGLLGEICREVVTQIVEAELGVGAVGHVGLVGGALVVPVALVGLQDPERDSERVVDRLHPERIAASEVVVDRDEMDALAVGGLTVGVARLERVEDDGQRGRQRLSLAGLHLGDRAVVQDHPADQLDVEVALAERPLGDLARECERLEEQLVQRLAVHRTLAELVVALAQLLVGLELELRLEVVDPRDVLLERLELLSLADAQSSVENRHGAERSSGACSPGSESPSGDSPLQHVVGRLTAAVAYARRGEARWASLRLRRFSRWRLT